MKNKIIVFPVLVFIFLVSASVCSAATIFTDNFNSYSDGNINNQGGWSGSSFTNVQGEMVFEGAKAVQIYNPYPGTFNIEKLGTLTGDGRITVYLQGHIGGTTHPVFEITLKEGSTVMLSAKAYTGFGFGYYNADVAGNSFLSPLIMASDAWYAVQIEWRSSDHKARYRINDGNFTDWHGGLANWSAGLDTVNISLADGVGYVDTIQENPISDKTPVLIVPGLLGTELFNQSEKLWLDLNRNFTDIGDQFMDSLGLKSNLSSDINLNLGNIISKETVNIGLGQVLIFDYNFGLIAELKNQGYVENETLFTFPYDWRYGVSGKYADGKTNADLLAEKIQSILTKTGSDKVDVVAHSLGGLVVKKYVGEHQSNHHINKTIFVGVPNTGAPKAIKVLLQGDNFGIPWLAQDEMKKISGNLPAAYDLLPSQQYYDTKGSFVTVIDQGTLGQSTYTQKDLNYSEFENFITADHSLNSQAFTNAENLHANAFDNFDMRSAGVDVYAIDGCKAGTLGKVIEHRFKNVFGQSFTEYKSPKMVPGDGTVPLESATNLPVDSAKKYYALTGEHSKMMSQDGSRQEIVNLLTGSNLSVDSKLITQDITKCNLNGKAISVFSPISIFATDQDGNKIGLADDGSIVNEIPNADFEIWGEPFDSFDMTQDKSAQDKHQFLYLPTDEGQVYDIKIKGTGVGTYTIDSQNIANGEVTGTEVFSNLPVTIDLMGNVNLGAQTTLTIQPTPTSQIQTILPSAIITGAKSQDIAPPISVATLSGKTFTAGNYKGQYKKEATVTITAKDAVIIGHENETSGVLTIAYNIDNIGFKKVVGDKATITITKEGSHTVSFFATDNAGNNELIKTLTFAIKKAD